MDLESSRYGPYHLITVNATRIDASMAITFKDAIRALTADGDDDVALDLAQVQFIDSSGLGAIVATLKHMGPGRRLHVACPTPDVAKVLRLTRMETIMGIHDTLDGLAPRQAG